MSIAIGKVLGGVLLSGGGIVAITGTTLWLNNSDNDIFIYAISEEVTDKLASTEISKTGENKNYQCKFDGNHHECEITESEGFDTTTKQWSIDKITTNTGTGATTITKETLKTNDNIYKIKINKKIGDWSSKTDAKIEIISTATAGNDVDKKYASLKPLFAMNSNKTINEHTKTKYFVVKSASTGTGDSSATYKCLTDKETIDSSTQPDEECNIYDFFENSEANKNWHEIIFKKLVAPQANVEVEANKYYLVKLKEEVKVKGVVHIKIQKYVNNAATDVVLDAGVLIPAIRDKEDGDNIFILKKADVTDQQASGGGS